jgi:hypothetical protein
MLVYVCDVHGHCGYVDVEEPPAYVQQYQQQPQNIYRFEYGERGGSFMQQRWLQCPNGTTCYEYRFNY